MTLIIGIITTIITLLIIALEVMIGYERGIRRNLIRVVMLIGVAVLTMYATPPVAELVVRKLVVTNRLNDYLYGLTGINPGGFYIFQESAVNLFTIFLNPFVYVVLFWIFKFITFGIYLLMDRYVINRKLAKLFPSPTKKSCIGGAILGGFYAVLIGAIFFMPVSAYSELLQRTETATIAAGQAGGVSELLGTNRYRMAVGYQNTPAYYFYKYTGSKQLGDAMFSSLTTKNVAVATVSVDQSIPSIVKVYYAAKVLRNGITQNQSSEENADYINSLNIIVDVYSTNGLIIGTEEEKVALVNDLLKQGDLFANNELMQSMIKNMEYTSLSGIQKDMKTLMEFSTLLTEKEILSDLLKDVPDLSPKEFIDRLDEATIIRIEDQLYSMDQAEIIVPILTEKLLGLMLGETGLGEPNFEKIPDFAATKEDFVDVCNAGKQLAYLMDKDNSIEKTEAVKVLEESLQILDGSKLISQDTFQNFKEFIYNKVNISSESK